jgi:CelD/BcsL family acetyltransferase involved in cellulose biosynthesis
MSCAYKQDRLDPTVPVTRISVSATRDIASLESVWRTFEANAVGHVFQTFSFVSAWCTHIAPAEGIEPIFVTGTEEDGRILYLLPLGLRGKLGTRSVEWLGGDQADYLGGLFDAGYLQSLSDDKAAFDAFVDDFVGAIGGADYLHLPKMPANYRGIPNPFLQAGAYQNANSAHSTHLAPDWDAYYKSKRKSGWRRTDRSKERQLAEMGELDFVIAKDAETLEAILSALFEQKREGLARIGVDDMFAPPGVRDFYRRIAHDSLDGNGSVQVSALYCGDEIAAANYGLVFRDTYYYVLHSYDLGRFADKSPGRQLMYKLMQWSFDNGIADFDFTIGDEAYKDQWCEDTLNLVDAAIALTAAGTVSSGAAWIWERTKRQIKNDRTLWSAAVNARKAFLHLRRG